MKNSRSVFIFYCAIGLVAGVFVLAPALYIQSKLDPAPAKPPASFYDLLLGTVPTNTPPLTGHWPSDAVARQNAQAHCQETQNTNEELKMKN